MQRIYDNRLTYANHNDRITLSRKHVGDVNITIFNSKMEVQSQFEEKAAEYSEETGVGVEVYYSSDTVEAHLATKYSANDPYTLAMVDAKDIYLLPRERSCN